MLPNDCQSLNVFWDDGFGAWSWYCANNPALSYFLDNENKDANWMEVAREAKENAEVVFELKVGEVLVFEPTNKVVFKYYSNDTWKFMR
jgi:hypothetical protein